MKLKIFSEKGQAISIDAIVAITIFMVVLAAIITIWGNQNALQEKEIFLLDMKINGERTLGFLVRSPGETITGETNWEESPNTIDNLKFAGLAKRGMVIKQEKLAKMAYYADYYRSPADYEKMKAKMLLGYDFYFRLLDKSGEIIEEPEGKNMTSGKKPNDLDLLADPPSIPPSTVIILKRIVSYEGTNYTGEAVAELSVYKKK